MIDRALVIALPGKASAVVEGLETLRSILPHLLQIARGGLLLACPHAKYPRLSQSLLATFTDFGKDFLTGVTT